MMEKNLKQHKFDLYFLISKFLEKKKQPSLLFFSWFNKPMKNIIFTVNVSKLEESHSCNA